jgi:copper oxidase (laccase) domain-containing protein
VDAPVLGALRERYGTAVEDSLRPARPGHAFVDLGALALHALASKGLAPKRSARLPQACTRCDAQRFHSYRRDGAAAGRMLHFIAAR